MEPAVEKVSVKNFFSTVSRRMIDKRTGEESDVNFDVCNLHVENQPEKLCEKSYKCLPRFGSANLKRHILNKHSMDPAAQSYIGYVNSKLEKVVHNLHIIFFPVLKLYIIVEQREKVVCSNLERSYYFAHNKRKFVVQIC